MPAIEDKPFNFVQITVDIPSNKAKRKLILPLLRGDCTLTQLVSCCKVIFRFDSVLVSHPRLQRSSETYICYRYLFFLALPVFLESSCIRSHIILISNPILLINFLRMVKGSVLPNANRWTLHALSDTRIDLGSLRFKIER